MNIIYPKQFWLLGGVSYLVVTTNFTTKCGQNNKGIRL